MDLRVIQLARDYLAEADRFCQLLAQRAGMSNLILAWRKGNLLREGQLFDQIEYSFHGIGCRFSREEPPMNVDVDFPVDGEWNGFDAWRLHLYAMNHPGFEDLADRDVLARHLDDLVEAGFVIKGSGSVKAGFYFLNDAKDQGLQSV